MTGNLKLHGKRWYALLTLGVIILAIAGYAGYVLYPRFGLPAVQGASLLLLAVAAGIGSFFSPCSFPLLVTLLARHSSDEAPASDRYPLVKRALSFAIALSLGASGFLILSGIVLALAGEALFAGVTFTSTPGRIIRMTVGTVLIILGLIQLRKLPFNLDAVARLVTPLMQLQARQRRKNPLIGFTLLGFAYPLAGFG